MAAQRPLEFVLADAELAEIVTRGDENPGTLGPAEWERYNNYAFMVLLVGARPHKGRSAQVLARERARVCRAVPVLRGGEISGL